MIIIRKFHFLFSIYCIIMNELCFTAILILFFKEDFFMSTEKKGLGLISKLIIGIVAGAIIGLFLPEVLVRILVTVSSIFSLFLKFVIPFIIVSFVICGIADLAQGAGKLLGITTGIAYGSTILAGSIAYIVATNLFPRILGSNLASEVGDPSAGMLSSYFTIPLAPMLDVTAAIVFAFVMGIGISYSIPAGLCCRYIC